MSEQLGEPIPEVPDLEAMTAGSVTEPLEVTVSSPGNMGPLPVVLAGDAGSLDKIRDPDFPVVWPHEYVASGGLVEARSPFYTAWRVGKWVFRHLQGLERTNDGQLAYQTAAMRRLNGEGVEVVADKVRLIEAVSRLGYLAPKQVVVREDAPVDAREAQVLEAFPDLEAALICKPYCGLNGRGIIDIRAGSAPEFVSELMDRDYIIQERMLIGGEIRYVREIDNRGEVIQRIYFAKEIPRIHADGHRTKAELIQDSAVPGLTKRILMKRNANSLDTVLPEGSAMHVPQSKNYPPPNSIQPWHPEKQQAVRNVDMFMEEFIADLQTLVGHQMPVLCFDIGVIDPAVLEEPYDFDRMRQNLVPFECQMPFIVFRYITESASSMSDRWKLLKILWCRMAYDRMEDFLEPTDMAQSSRPNGASHLSGSTR